MNDLEEFRRQKDEFFRGPHSPLTPEQKRSFRGLKYFPENPALRLEVNVEPISGDQGIDMQTTGGDVQHYRRFGRFTFTVDGQEAQLTIFTDGQGYFLPFVDAQAGKETYGAGRYLEPEPLPNGKFLVDFNLAYNPYCAYNENWSCPLTPAENRLKVAIRAGEMTYE
jgi:uncharacterized protein (DUF1684 family)